MPNIELHLIAAMAETGDYSPIASGEVSENHFLTTEGKTLYSFIRAYRETDGKGYPSRATLEARFSAANLELPIVTFADSVPQLAHEVRVNAFRADLRSLSQEILLASQSSDPRTDTMTLLSKIRAKVDDLVPADALDFASQLPKIGEAYKAGGLIQSGIQFPWPTLNTATRGMRGGEFIVFSGRPKMRKTFVAISVAAHCVKKEHKRVLFFSPEMPPQQIMTRFAAAFADLPYKELKDGTLSLEDEDRLFRVISDYGIGSVERFDEEQYQLELRKRVRGIPDNAKPAFRVMHAANRTVSWIESQIDAFEPDLVVIDSFYRLRAEGGVKRNDDWKAISNISRSIKDLAMTAKVPIVSTCQLNRGAEGKIASMANVALSDAIAQDADILLQVYTRKTSGDDESALVILGGREADCHGVIIKNVPCRDFSEVGPITSLKQLDEFYEAEKEEEKEARAQEKEEEQRRKALERKRSQEGIVKNRPRAPEAVAEQRVTETGMAVAALKNPVKKRTPPPVSFDTLRK